VYISSISSSSLTIGISMGSVTRLKHNISPENSWKPIANITINPNIAFTSWKETFRIVK
jgi:hypothetical protein